MRQTDILLGLMLAGVSALCVDMKQYALAVLCGLAVLVVIGHHIIVAIREQGGEIEETPDLLDRTWRAETNEIVREEARHRENQL